MGGRGDQSKGCDRDCVTFRKTRVKKLYLIDLINMNFLVFLVSKDLKTADLLWPFEDSAGGVSHDAIHNSVARFMGGAKVVSASARGRVATTSSASGWISLGDYKGNTPNTAESTFTVLTLDTTQHRIPQIQKNCVKNGLVSQCLSLLRLGCKELSGQLSSLN